MDVNLFYKMQDNIAEQKGISSFDNETSLGELKTLMSTSLVRVAG